MLPAQLGGLYASLVLTQHAYDLILGKTASPHRSSPYDGLTYQWHDFRGARHVGAALAVIDVPGRSAFLDVQTIRSLYDLTPTESKVACLVAEGRTPAEAAKSLGVSMETIRTHLKRTYAKTGTERQAGLSIQLRSLTCRRPD